MHGAEAAVDGSDPTKLQLELPIFLLAAAYRSAMLLRKGPSNACEYGRWRRLLPHSKFVTVRQQERGNFACGIVEVVRVFPSREISMALQETPARDAHM